MCRRSGSPRGCGRSELVSASAAARAFDDSFGGRPSGVWSAPGRVNLIGEHTDYNQGLCLPIALPQRTYAAARLRQDRLVRLWSAQATELVQVSLDDVGPGRPAGWAAYAAGVLWALEGAGHRVRGMDLALDGQVPLGAGLSSSAALECAVAVAAVELLGLDLLGENGADGDRDGAGHSDSNSDGERALARLAALCVKAENHIAQAPTGGMDQSAALRCQAGHALLLDCRDGGVAQVPFDLARHDLALLVMDTRAEHALVDGQYASRRAACEEAARLLGVASLREVGVADLDQALSRLPEGELRPRTRHVVTEIGRVSRTVELLGEGRFAEVGAVFDQSHASMRDDFEISCAELDLAVETATSRGALGARMTGGGFGGSAIALLLASAVDGVSAAVTAAFAAGGFRAPNCFAVTASGPAGRDAVAPVT